MKVFARWIKYSPHDYDGETLYFRKNMVLQFGDSWDIIGAAILINPGSAMPTEEGIDDEVKARLQKITGTSNNHGDWRVFKDDSTMVFLEKIFSGWYLGQCKKLEGVILLYNLFNLKCEKLNEALNLRSQFKDAEEMMTTADELTTLDVPFYIGWGTPGKSDLRKEAQEIFSSLRDRVRYYTDDDFDNALFYHPLYVNTSYHKEPTRRMLSRFLCVEDNFQPILKINESMAQQIKECVKSHLNAALIVESDPSKISFTTQEGELTVGLVVQKSKQYIYWQHSDFNARQTYRNFSDSYSHVSAIREILKANGYDITFDSLLGRKNLKEFAATSVEETSNLILEEVDRISKSLSSL